MKKGAIEKEAVYVHGEVVDFVFEDPHDLVIEGVDRKSQQVVKAAIVSEVLLKIT